MKIEITRLGAISKGEHIVAPDDDTTEGYEASDQDWQIVRKLRGHADIGDLLLEAYDGSREWARAWSWDAAVWRLTLDNGEPVIADEYDDED